MVIGVVSYLIKAVMGLDIALYVGVMCGCILFLFRMVTPLPSIVTYYVVVVFMGAGFILINNGIDAGKMYLPIMLSSIGISATIIQTVCVNRDLHFFISSTIIWGLIVYVLVFFILNGPVAGAFAGSRNHVSTGLILLSAYYCIVRRFNGRDISLVLPCAVFCMCVLFVGTSGIISSAIFLFGVLISKRLPTVLVVFVSLVIVILSIDIPMVLDMIDNDLIRKIEYKMSEGDVRINIISQYIDKIDVYRFFLGVPLDDLFWTGYHMGVIPMSSDNLHNSYLLLHAKIGVLAFLVIIGLVVVSVKLLRKDLVIFFLFMSILARSFTDTIVLSHGYYEWCLLLIVFYAYSKVQVSRVISINTRETKPSSNLAQDT